MFRYAQGRGEDANVKEILAEKRHRASESGGAFADKKAGALALVWDGEWLVVRSSRFAMDGVPTGGQACDPQREDGWCAASAFQRE
jgi:hypothetical protein